MNENKNILKEKRRVKFSKEDLRGINKCGHNFFNEFGLLWEYVYDKNHSGKHS